MTTELASNLFHILKQAFNYSSPEDVMCSAFKLALVENFVLWECICLSLVQERR